MTKIVFRVEGMECPNCAMTLEGMEDRLAGVRMVEASYRKGQMTVEFDETKISAAEIIAEVRRLGYTSSLPA